MNPYSNETASKKKWLVPLVAVLMCGIAMTGAAYAYNSTINGSGDIPDVDYITLNFAEATTDEYDADTLTYTASKALTFNHEKVYKDGEGVVDTYTADNSVVLFTVKVIIDSEHSAHEGTVTTPVVTFASDQLAALHVELVIKSTSGNATDGWTYVVVAQSTESLTEAPAKAEITDISIKATAFVDVSTETVPSA